MTPTKRNQPRVILDTNIFVSALLIPSSTPGRLLHLWHQNRFKLTLSPATLTELASTLNQSKLTIKHPIQPTTINKLLHTLTQAAEVHFPKTVPLLPMSSRDPDDNKFLTLSLSAQVQFLVTGDKDLLTLTPSYQKHGLTITTPALFLEKILSTKARH